MFWEDIYKKVIWELFFEPSVHNVQYSLEQNFLDFPSPVWESNVRNRTMIGIRHGTKQSSTTMTPKLRVDDLSVSFPFLSIGVTMKVSYHDRCTSQPLPSI